MTSVSAESHDQSGGYTGPLDTFFDAETHGPFEFELRRVTPTDWRLLRQFGFHHHDFDTPFICPADMSTYSTDLASTPWIFQWVVPARGRLFPAIMLHDALVLDESLPADERKTYIGDDVSRERADSIMRDAMASLGVGFVRRWLAWTGASIATAWATFTPVWWWRLLIAVTFGGISVLGVLATLDLVDVIAWVPWMGNRSTAAELGLGAAFAVAIPVGLSLLWGRRWKVAVIGGVVLALLLHITLAMVAAFLLYQLAEAIASPLRRSQAEIDRDQAALEEIAAASSSA